MESGRPRRPQGRTHALGFLESGGKVAESRHKRVIRTVSAVPSLSLPPSPTPGLREICLLCRLLSERLENEEQKPLCFKSD